jgi:hypothetical protein
MTMRRSLSSLAAAAALTLAACGTDAPTALSTPSPASFVKGPSDVSRKGDTVVTVLNVDPRSSRSWRIAGEHKITIPARTVCDPAQSSYGPGEWDKPCVLLTSRLEITAKSYETADGQPRVDFFPALRFVSNGRDVVTLHMLDKHGAANTLSNIRYCSDETGTCVDESLADPSVATRVDSKGGFLYRRLKHFSGYTIAVGRSYDEY